MGESVRIDIDIEAGLFQQLSARCISERVDFHEMLNAWLRRANRQERTVMPIPERAAKVLEMKR